MVEKVKLFVAVEVCDTVGLFEKVTVSVFEIEIDGVVVGPREMVAVLEEVVEKVVVPIERVRDAVFPEPVNVRDEVKVPML